jgi:hypothetical protein
MTAPTDRRSRYRSAPQVLAPDPQRRVLPALDFRLLPATTGTYQHVVQDGDRIDQLASTYYSLPLTWWHICDANPDFLSPFELLAADPVITTELPIISSAPTLPWADLVTPLRRTAGVEIVQVQDEVVLDPVRRTGIHGDPVTVYLERPVRALLVTHNDLAAPADQLVRSALALGWQIGPVVRVSQVGREIAIPPAVSG